MGAVLEIYDERNAGAARALRHRVELPVDRITARDLIRCRIETDVALHNAAAATSGAAERDAANAWLVVPGSVERALNGPRRAYGPRPFLGSPRAIAPAECERMIAVALDAFQRNGFFMIFDDRQITDLDEMVTVGDDSALVFLRLVPLVGG